ncbi:MAG: DHH family phosphoesterase [Rickettsiales bacterium]|nr:DHH family phosphoesterase [Rickettsiales bacterium]
MAHSSDALSANNRRWKLMTSPVALREDLADFSTFCARLRDERKTLPDFQASVNRLADAIERNETIGISSDYDCDGNCSLALMLRLLNACGVPKSKRVAHVPNRFTEGYGINEQAVRDMKKRDVSLLLTLDNGTLAHRPLAQAHAENMDVIVADHHPNQAGEPLPAHALIVNANRTDASCSAAMKSLAAVGITFVLCQGVIDELHERGYFKRRQIDEPDMSQSLGLVALATVADVVSIGDWINRYFVKTGLRMIREGRDPQLTSLCAAAQIAPDTLTEEHLGFALGPVVNAPGRLNKPDDPLWHDAPDAWRLLSEPHDSEQSLAGFLRLKAYNEERKRKTAALTDQARQQAVEQMRDPHRRVLVVGGMGEAWHPGIVGIVASRLMEEFGVPTVVAAYDGQKHYKMSARSIRANGEEGLLIADIGDAFRREKTAGGLAHGGGHPFAAGATLECPPQKHEMALTLFAERLNVRLGEAVDRVRAAAHTEVAKVVDVAHLPADLSILDNEEVRKEALRCWLRTKPFNSSITQLAQQLTGCKTMTTDRLAQFGDVTQYTALEAIIAQDVAEARPHAFSALKTQKPGYVREQLLNALCARDEQQRPYGEGNRPPLSVLPHMVVRHVKEIGDGRHLQLKLSPLDDARTTIHAQAFHVSPALRALLQPTDSKTLKSLALLGVFGLSDTNTGGTPNLAPSFRIEDAYAPPHRQVGRHPALEKILENYSSPAKESRVQRG